MTSPTASEVDLKAKEYLRLKDEVGAILKKASDEANDKQVRMAELREELTGLVAKYGSQHAEKSKLLHGVKFEVMGTFGQEVKIDAQAVDTFRQALQEQRQTRLLNRIFEKAIRWTLKPGSADILREFKLAPKLAQLYAACQVIKDRTPLLQVREKSA